MSSEPKPLSVREKLAYGLGDFGANLIGQTQQFLFYFYTEVVAISARDAGLILLVSRVLDAVNDPIVGALADRTNSRWGRYRPWILISAMPLAIALVLCYTMPSFGATNKIAWAVVTYNLLMVLYAANNIPYCALSGVMTDDSTERTSLASWRFVCAMVATLAVSMFTLDVVNRIGRDDEASGFPAAMVVWGALAIVCFVITFAFTRERIEPNPMQHFSLRQDLLDLMRSGPWIALFMLAVLISIQLALRTGTMLFYFKHYVVRQDSIWGFSPFGLFNGVGMAFVIIGVVLARPLAERFGKRNLMLASLFLASLFMALFATVPRDAIGWLFTLQILMQLSFAPSIPLLWTMMADVADYVEWKTNRRSTALAFASIVFGLKLGSGIGGWFSGAWLAHVGYVSKTIPTESATRGIVDLVSVFPALALLLGCIVLFFYRIDDSMEEQMKLELRDRRQP